MQNRYQGFNSVEDTIFLGVAVLVISISAVSIYHGIASAIDPEEHQAQVAASWKQKPAPPTAVAQAQDQSGAHGTKMSVAR
jgi:hypothetical protein